MKSELNWDIPLNFDLPPTEIPVEIKKGKIPARTLIKRTHPHIFSKIESLWCTKDLHNYMAGLLLSDRDGRQGSRVARGVC